MPFWEGLYFVHVPRLQSYLLLPASAPRQEDLGDSRLGSLASSSAGMKWPETAPWPVLNSYGSNQVALST